MDPALELLTKQKCEAEDDIVRIDGELDTLRQDLERGTEHMHALVDQRKAKVAASQALGRAISDLDGYRRLMRR